MYKGKMHSCYITGERNRERGRGKGREGEEKGERKRRRRTVKKSLTGEK
jgi:hypothetical protein